MKLHYVLKTRYNFLNELGETAMVDSFSIKHWNFVMQATLQHASSFKLQSNFALDFFFNCEQCEEQILVCTFISWIWDHSFCTYGKFLENLIFITPWYTHVRVRIRGQDVFVFCRILCTYWMNDPIIYRVRKSIILKMRMISTCASLHWSITVKHGHGKIWFKPWRETIYKYLCHRWGD